MADQGYLQLTVTGSAGGQAFNNILFYGADGGTTTEWTDPLIGAFLAEWGETVVDTWLAAMPDDYTLLSLSGRVVDERGTVLSDNAVVLGVALPGTLGQDINGPFQTAIIRLPTIRAEFEGARAMKRSYIAFGPLGSTTMTATGELVLVAKTYLQEVADLLAAPIIAGVGEFYPVRVGRTVAPAAPAVGIVTQGIVDPFGSFRASRKRRANGT